MHLGQVLTFRDEPVRLSLAAVVAVTVAGILFAAVRRGPPLAYVEILRQIAGSVPRSSAITFARGLLVCPGTAPLNPRVRGSSPWRRTRPDLG
jgi:hypothetical protein